MGIRMKLNAMPRSWTGATVVLVDDSIVRGSTTRQLVQMVREAGATEIHLRISSPPYRWPCFYGMDTGDRSTLLAADRTVEEIAEYLEVDSLAYLELGVPARRPPACALTGSAPPVSPATTRPTSRSPATSSCSSGPDGDLS